MLCAQVFCRDRSCELCRTSRRWLIAILTTAAALVTVAVVVLVLLVSGGCASEDDDTCEPTMHLDTTGNSIDCACDCDGDDACPLIPGTERSRVPDCWEENNGT